MDGSSTYTSRIYMIMALALWLALALARGSRAAAASGAIDPGCGAPSACRGVCMWGVFFMKEFE